MIHQNDYLFIYQNRIDHFLFFLNGKTEMVIKNTINYYASASQW